MMLVVVLQHLAKTLIHPDEPDTISRCIGSMATWPCLVVTASFRQTFSCEMENRVTVETSIRIYVCNCLNATVDLLNVVVFMTMIGSLELKHW